MTPHLPAGAPAALLLQLPLELVAVLVQPGPVLFHEHLLGRGSGAAVAGGRRSWARPRPRLGSWARPRPGRGQGAHGGRPGARSRRGGAGAGAGAWAGA